jgi:hypothetical protein
VFESFGLPSETAILRASGVINIIQLLASMPVIFTLDLLGRRPLLLLGSVYPFKSKLIQIGMTVAHLGVAIVAAYVGRDWRGRTTEGNICAGLICIPLQYFL